MTRATATLFVPPTPTAIRTPAQIMVEAREADRIGEWEQAATLYESLTLDADHAPAALFYLGDLYLRQERPADAARVWEEALLLQPDGQFSAAIRYRLARGLSALGEHEQALALWEQVDAEDDRADDVLAERLAESYLALGQPREAVKQWERLYNMDDARRVPRALTAQRLGDWYAGEEQWEEAVLWYERALELSEVHTYRAQLVATLARTAQSSGESGYALKQWRTLVREYPDTPEALVAADALETTGTRLSLYEKGELYLANEQWRQAARTFWESLEEEDLAEAHQQVAFALERAGDHEAARKEWQKIVDTHPEAEALRDDALLGIGRAYAALGDPTTARTIWQQVVSEFPEGDAAPAALWESAELLRSTQPATAAAMYERLAAEYPEDEGAAAALWEAGLIHFRDGNARQARKDFEALAAIDEEEPARAWFWAGKAAQLAGDEEAAEQFWDNAVRSGEGRYYALRAVDLRDERSWQPRAGVGFVRPSGDGDDLAWLHEAAQLPEGADPSALPDDPMVAKGAALLLFGERDAAFDTFLDAIDSQEGNPQRLWALAHYLEEQHLPSLSTLAARKVMDELDYTILDAPPALAQVAYPLPFEAQLRTSAAQWGYDPLFFASLIYQESRWEPRARSSAAARGLTQVIPDTGAWIAQRLGDSAYQYSDLDRPVVALHYGSYYLDYVLDLFDNNPYQALAAYNGGPGNARRWANADDDLFVENITFPETRLYVESIYSHWHAYNRIYRIGR